jgi:hypothetical protein
MKRHRRVLNGTPLEEDRGKHAQKREFTSLRSAVDCGLADLISVRQTAHLTIAWHLASQSCQAFCCGVQRLAVVASAFHADPGHNLPIRSHCRIHEG